MEQTSYGVLSRYFRPPAQQAKDIHEVLSIPFQQQGGANQREYACCELYEYLQAGSEALAEQFAELGGVSLLKKILCLGTAREQVAAGACLSLLLHHDGLLAIADVLEAKLPPAIHIDAPSALPGIISAANKLKSKYLDSDTEITIHHQAGAAMDSGHFFRHVGFVAGCWRRYESAIRQQQEALKSEQSQDNDNVSPTNAEAQNRSKMAKLLSEAEAMDAEDRRKRAASTKDDRGYPKEYDFNAPVNSTDSIAQPPINPLHMPLPENVTLDHTAIETTGWIVGFLPELSEVSGLAMRSQIASSLVRKDEIATAMALSVVVALPQRPWTLVIPIQCIASVTVAEQQFLRAKWQAALALETSFGRGPDWICGIYGDAAINRENEFSPSKSAIQELSKSTMHESAPPSVFQAIQEVTEIEKDDPNLSPELREILADIGSKANLHFPPAMKPPRLSSSYSVSQINRCLAGIGTIMQEILGASVFPLDTWHRRISGIAQGARKQGYLKGMRLKYKFHRRRHGMMRNRNSKISPRMQYNDALAGDSSSSSVDEAGYLSLSSTSSEEEDDSFLGRAKAKAEQTKRDREARETKNKLRQARVAADGADCAEEIELSPLDASILARRRAKAAAEKAQDQILGTNEEDTGNESNQMASGPGMGVHGIFFNALPDTVTDLSVGPPLGRWLPLSKERRLTLLAEAAKAVGIISSDQELAAASDIIDAMSDDEEDSFAADVAMEKKLVNNGLPKHRKGKAQIRELTKQSTKTAARLSAIVNRRGAEPKVWSSLPSKTDDIRRLLGDKNLRGRIARVQIIEADEKAAEELQEMQTTEEAAMSHRSEQENYPFPENSGKSAQNSHDNFAEEESQEDDVFDSLSSPQGTDSTFTISTLISDTTEGISRDQQEEKRDLQFFSKSKNGALRKKKKWLPKSCRYPKFSRRKNNVLERTGQMWPNAICFGQVCSFLQMTIQHTAGTRMVLETLEDEIKKLKDKLPFSPPVHSDTSKSNQDSSRQATRNWMDSNSSVYPVSSRHLDRIDQLALKATQIFANVCFDGSGEVTIELEDSDWSTIEGLSAPKSADSSTADQVPSISLQSCGLQQINWPWWLPCRNSAQHLVLAGEKHALMKDLAHNGGAEVSDQFLPLGEGISGSSLQEPEAIGLCFTVLETLLNFESVVEFVASSAQYTESQDSEVYTGSDDEEAPFENVLKYIRWRTTPTPVLKVGERYTYSIGAAHASVEEASNLASSQSSKFGKTQVFGQPNILDSKLGSKYQGWLAKSEVVEFLKYMKAAIFKKLSQSAALLREASGWNLPTSTSRSLFDYCPVVRIAKEACTLPFSRLMRRSDLIPPAVNSTGWPFVKWLSHPLAMKSQFQPASHNLLNDVSVRELLHGLCAIVSLQGFHPPLLEAAVVQVFKLCSENESHHSQTSAESGQCGNSGVMQEDQTLPNPDTPGAAKSQITSEASKLLSIPMVQCMQVCASPMVCLYMRSCAASVVLTYAAGLSLQQAANKNRELDSAGGHLFSAYAMGSGSFNESYEWLWGSFQRPPSPNPQTSQQNQTFSDLPCGSPTLQMVHLSLHLVESALLAFQDDQTPYIIARRALEVWYSCGGKPSSDVCSCPDAPATAEESLDFLRERALSKETGEMGAVLPSECKERSFWEVDFDWADDDAPLIPPKHIFDSMKAGGSKRKNRASVIALFDTESESAAKTLSGRNGPQNVTRKLSTQQEKL